MFFFLRVLPKRIFSHVVEVDEIGQMICGGDVFLEAVKCSEVSVKVT